MELFAPLYSACDEEHCGSTCALPVHGYTCIRGPHTCIQNIFLARGDIVDLPFALAGRFTRRDATLVGFLLTENTMIMFTLCGADSQPADRLVNSCDDCGLEEGREKAELGLLHSHLNHHTTFAIQLLQCLD